MSINSKLFTDVQRKIETSFESSAFNEANANKNISSTNVDYEKLEAELEKLLYFTKNEMWLGNFYHSLFIFGPTGTGKSMITEQLAEKHGAMYHKLELQKIPLEILQGFPYLEDDEELGSKLAKLAPSTILPPSDDDRVWILHLDEYNKADTDKMAAVMNLILTGELGGTADYKKNKQKSEKYRLPRKTLIIGCGNTKEQKNVENLNIVSSMDTASSERWHRTVNLNYNSESWLKSFATLPYTYEGHELPMRVQPIIVNFVLEKTINEGSEAPFLIPVKTGSEEGAEGERTTSPRAWTIVSDMMLLDMKRTWDGLSKEEKSKFEKIGKEKNMSGFAAYSVDSNNQVEFLKRQTYEFGLDGQGIVSNIISNFSFFAGNRVLPENILFDYADYRERILKMKERTGMILYLLLGVGHYINNMPEEQKIELQEKNDGKLFKKVAVNISTFIKDNNINPEDLVAFVQALEKAESGSECSMPKNLHETLIRFSERYKNGTAGHTFTSVKEIG